MTQEDKIAKCLEHLTAIVEAHDCKLNSETEAISGLVQRVESGNQALAEALSVLTGQFAEMNRIAKNASLQRVERRALAEKMKEELK